MYLFINYSFMAKEEKKSLRDYSTNRENPYMDGLIIKTKEQTIAFGTNKNKRILNTETSELDEDTLLISVKKKVDKEHFVKLYTGVVKELFELSKSAFKVFCYILSVVEFKDLVILEIEACKQFCSYKSVDPIYDGVVELIERKIIAKGPIAGTYYINPSVIYKGDRVVLLTEYHRLRTPTPVQQDPIRDFEAQANVASED